MASLIDRIQNAMLGGAGADKMRELLIELNIPLGGGGENAMRDIRKSILYSTDSEDELRTGLGNLGLTGISTGVRPMPRIRAAILLNRSDSEPQLRAAIDDLLGADAALSHVVVASAGSYAVAGQAATLSRADAFVGCVAKLNADLTAQNFSAGTTYMACSGADVVDTNTLHDPASNNTRITIPSALNNRYGIFVAHTTIAVLDGSPLYNVTGIRKSGGSNHYAGGIWGTLQGVVTGRTSYQTVSTPPILLVTNDYYEALVQIQDTSTTLVAASTSFSLFVVG